MARQDPTQDSCRNVLARGLTMLTLMIVGLTAAVRVARKNSRGKK